MNYSQVKYQVEDRIATVTLNRPERLNAWTDVMGEEVHHCMTQAAEDDGVRVIILTGAGRGFCAGADMKNLQRLQQGGSAGSAAAAKDEIDMRVSKDVPKCFGDRFTFFASVPKPVIAAINGPVAGIGLVVAMFCDFRFVSDTAKILTVFVKRGLVAEYGISWILSRTIGVGNAAELLYSGRIVEAEETLRIGLASKIFPQETFLDHVRAYAKDIAKFSSPRSMRKMKAQIFNDLFISLEDSIRISKEEMVKSFDSEDFHEGVRHFLEKREPQFTGR
jgi:enoyl-CoA hydratase/carnithine racemase